MPPERFAEIECWLLRPVTPSEVLTRLKHDGDAVSQPTKGQRIVERIILLATGIWIASLFWRIAYGARRTSAECFTVWLDSHDLSEAELWEYDTGGDSWARLRGECGFAAVYDGRVADFWTYFEN